MIILREEGEAAYTPREQAREAEAAARGLVKAGVRPGDRVGIVAQDAPCAVLAFPGC